MLRREILIQHVPVQVNGAPEVGSLALDRQENLVQMPFIARLRTSSTKFVGTLLPDRAPPAPYRFIAEHDATRCHQLFDIAKTQGESEVEPNRMRNKLGWIAVTLVA